MQSASTTEIAKTSLPLSELLDGIVSVDALVDCLVTGLSSDSRHVSVGDCFLAYPGIKVDGRQFIKDAVDGGAIAVLCEDDEECADVITRAEEAGHDVPIIAVPQLQERLGDIASRFYEHPSQTMTIVGVTGTNGKTSCTQYLASALQALKTPCGVIGTIGTGFPDKLEPSVYTTPDPLQLQKQCLDLKNRGAKAIAMEVSSHGLEQNRVQGIAFDVAMFTNITRDHLDYHGDMKSYREAKRRLFQRPGLKAAVINADDAFGQELIKELSPTMDVYAYTIENATADVPLIIASNIELMHTGFTAQVETPWGKGKLQSDLLGRFNVSNLLGVLTILCVLKVPLKKALATLPKTKTVSGRMQAFGGGKKPLVVVDYAHTPDALEKVLTVLREHCHGKLWCVFGAGGDRDRGKRALMAEVVERYSDQIVITDDNPRYEEPQQIVDDIVTGLLCPWAAEIEHDRGSAIAHAISCATPGDVVLVAGKGHEPHQLVGAERIPFNDAEQVQRLINST